MLNKFGVASVGLGMMLLAGAVPASATALLSFNQTGTGTLSSGIETWNIGSISEGGNSYTISSGEYLIATLNTTTDVLTITADGSASLTENPFGFTSNTTIYSATTTLSGTAPNLTFTDNTPVAINPTVFSDLETSTYSKVVPTGTVNAFTLAGTTSGSGNSVLSSGVGLTAVPEPSSFTLVGVGVLAAALIRKRIRPAVPAQR